jgi:hypothetical protein
VGSVVADQRQRVSAAAVGDDLERRRAAVGVGQRAAEVTDLVIDLHRQGRARQARADRSGRVGAGGRRR